MHALLISELFATVASGCFGYELATQSLFNGVLKYVWWEYSSFCWVYVIDPLVVHLWVPEFAESAHVVVGFVLVQC